ncbi:hypothetical protein [Streptomyces sp. NPDC060194]|uniref:hypothetical protein n=1 Tax=Streptomyces sp. NPDC060194 TaxID=3347069 RepID=UPI003665CE11
MTIGVVIFLAAVALAIGRTVARRRRIANGIDLTPHRMPNRVDLVPGRSGPPRDLDEETWSVIEAVRERHEWKAAAIWLADAGRDGNERWHRHEILSQLAQQNRSWLQEWLRERPQDGSALALHAGLEVTDAWEIRGSGFANTVTDEMAAGFERGLAQAERTARQAAEHSPEDPTPWVTLITLARGKNTGKDRFREIWDQLVLRCPDHFHAHWQALQYWCAKWHGSQEEMYAFARAAADRAEPGSLLSTVYLHALVEDEQRSSPHGVFRTAGVHGAWIEKARADVAHALPSDPNLAAARHLLASALTKRAKHESGLKPAERAALYEEALTQFRIIGPFCGGTPWKNADDPVAEFDKWRTTAVLERERQAKLV